MRRLTRPPEPACLVERGAEWTQRWVTAEGDTPWRWPMYHRERLNVILGRVLSAMTDEHCSYCDGYPFDMSSEVVEHFRPKAVFRALAFAWSNLYLTCTRCNDAKRISEQGGFDERLLAPDADDYSFHRYFIVDYATGRILENPNAPPEDRARARVTLHSLGMNNFGRPKRRRDVFRQCSDAPADERPFRFLFDEPASDDAAG